MQIQSGEIRRAMKPVADALDELNIAYAVVGSVAGLTHGFSRFTMDIDIVAFITEDVVTRFTARLQADYYVDEVSILDAIRHRQSFNLICNANGFRIDVFVPARDAWQKEVMRRREPEAMDEEQSAFYVQSAEDLALSKLRWYRMTNETSERQWKDALGVLKMQCFDMDIDYLERWAREIGVADLLDRALDEAGLKDIKE